MHIEVARWRRDQEPRRFEGIHPASGDGPSGAAPADQYLVSLEAKPTSAKLVLWRLRVAHGAMSIAKVAKAVKRVSLPPYGYQCNGTTHANTLWDTGDLRLTSAFYDGDTHRLYAATAVSGQRRGRSERVGDPLVRGRSRSARSIGPW